MELSCKNMFNKINIKKISLYLLTGLLFLSIFSILGVGEVQAGATHGTISCSTVDKNNISISYNAKNFSNGSIYRGSTKIVQNIKGDYSDTLNHTNLNPDTSYIFSLRDNGTLISSSTCKTEKEVVKEVEPSGTISCSTVDKNNISISYNAKNFSNGSIYRNSTKIVQNIKGDYSDTLNHTNLNPDTSYTFSLRDNGTLISSSTCKTEKEVVKEVEPTGYLECTRITDNSIRVTYEGSDVTNASLFRGNTRLSVLGSGDIYGNYINTGLSPDTRYTYYLRDGRYTSSDRLASVSCRTLKVDEEKEIDISKRVKIKDSGNTFYNSIDVAPGEYITYSIEVFAEGDTLRNVTVKDELSTRIYYEGNLRVDGSIISGNIKDGVNIGTISSGKSKTVTFDAKVAPTEKFLIGTTTIKNVASAYSDDLSVNDSAIVNVVKEREGTTPPATEAPTGITGNTFLDYILIPFLLALTIFFLFKKHIIAFVKRIEEARTEVRREWV